MIIVTPNPAVDRTLIVPALIPGEVNRSTRTLIAAGGKGLNAARAVQTLGGTALCMGFIGGRAGNWFAQLAEADHFRGAWTRMNGETRTCTIIVAENGEPTVINEPGPKVDRGSWETLHTDILSTYKMHIGNRVSHLVAFCGSLPPESPLELFTDLINDLNQTGACVWIDTSGPALQAALKGVPAGIKVNLAEVGAAAGRDLHNMEEALRAAQTIHERGIQCVVITLGKDGALLLNRAGAWHAAPPPIAAVSNVGSGDSFFGALLLGFEKQLPAAEVLRRGVAAGAANALSAGGANFSRGDFEALLKKVVVKEI